MEFLLSLFRWWRPALAVPMLPCKPCQRPPRTLTHDTLLRIAKENPPPAEWTEGDESCPFIPPRFVGDDIYAWFSEPQTLKPRSVEFIDDDLARVIGDAPTETINYLPMPITTTGPEPYRLPDVDQSLQSSHP